MGDKQKSSNINGTACNRSSPKHSWRTLNHPRLNSTANTSNERGQVQWEDKTIIDGLTDNRHRDQVGTSEIIVIHSGSNTCVTIRNSPSGNAQQVDRSIAVKRHQHRDTELIQDADYVRLRHLDMQKFENNDSKEMCESMPTRDGTSVENHRNRKYRPNACSANSHQRKKSHVATPRTNVLRMELAALMALSGNRKELEPLLEDEQSKKLKISTALMQSLCFKSEIVGVLDKHLIQARFELLKSDSNLLHMAVVSNDLSTVELCCQRGLSFVDTDTAGRTPLNVAIGHSNLDVVRHVLNCTLALSQYRDMNGASYLHLAAIRGDPDILETCLKRLYRNPGLRSLINVADQGGWTPLMHAVAHENHACSELLLARDGIKVNIVDYEGNTAAHWSSLRGTVRSFEVIFEFSLSNKANLIDVVNNNGDSALHIALRWNREDMVRALVHRGADPLIANKDGELPGHLLESSSLSTAVEKVLRDYIARSEKCVGSCQADCLLSVERTLLDDISLDKAVHPVPCVSWVKADTPPSFFYYLKENMISKDFKNTVTANHYNPCECSERHNCNTARCTCYGSHGIPTYDQHGLINPLVLHSNESRYVFECDNMCSCLVDCPNRVVQRGPKVLVKVFKRADQSWAVKTVDVVRSYQFVFEYLGQYEGQLNESSDYAFCFVNSVASEDDKTGDDRRRYNFDLSRERYFLDAKKFGNAARFAKHSCSPNMTPIKIFKNCLDYRFPRICFFANRDIASGEELTFSYKGPWWSVNSKNRSFDCGCGEHV